MTKYEATQEENHQPKLNSNNQQLKEQTAMDKKPGDYRLRNNYIKINW